MADGSRQNDEDRDKDSKRQCVYGGTKDDQPSVAASPPRFVSLEELMSAAKGMTNMSLAHEIAVNKDFKLEKSEAPSNSIEKITKETMHKAFWDILTDEINQTPPSYNQALILLGEVKSSLLALLLPQHSRLKQQIDQVLDVDLIKQQAENGTLNFQEYAHFVTSVMGRMCAPVRDEKIAELTTTTEIVPLFRGILETLELMRVDMANFTIDLMRPQIVANSVAYEKQKFADFLKFKTDGLERTREWLIKHKSAVGDDTVEKKKKIENVINDAYLDLVQWDPKHPLPETLTMDEARIREGTQTLRYLSRAGAVLLLTFSRAGPNLASIAAWKQSVKRHALTIITPSEPDQDLASVAVKMTADIASGAEKYSVAGHSITGLEDEIKQVSEKDHKVVNLLNSRIIEFLRSSITSRTADRLRIPLGLSVLQEELTQLAGQYLRMVSHNRAVFEEYYVDIVEKFLDDASSS